MQACSRLQREPALPFNVCKRVQHSILRWIANRKGIYQFQAKEQKAAMHQRYDVVFTNFRDKYERTISKLHQPTKQNVYDIKRHRMVRHIGPDRLSKAYLRVDEINHIEAKYIRNHQCVPCFESETKQAPTPAQKLKINHPL